MSSRVLCKGHSSKWFTVQQGTRQGGVISPFLFLLFIDELLGKLESSGVGYSVGANNCCCPTVADDMVLASLSKQGLDAMMQMCYEYSIKWRYVYNPGKSAVIVFNESANHFMTQSRTWNLGSAYVMEKIKYNHLGVLCHKYLHVDDSVNEACNKLRGTFLSIVNSGIYENGLHPLTSKAIYETLVLPKALYGCELWYDLNVKTTLSLERAHRFCVKFIQSVPRHTRTDVALSVLGVLPIEADIDKRKLIFLRQLCTLPLECVAKGIFMKRLLAYRQGSIQPNGFMQDIHRILRKYTLTHVLDDYVETGGFVSNWSWKRLIKHSIGCVVQSDWENTVQTDASLAALATIHIGYSPHAIWSLSKDNPHLSKCCQTAVKMLCKMFDRIPFQTCPKCEEVTSQVVWHVIYECSSNVDVRIQLHAKMQQQFGNDVFMKYMTHTPEIQMNALFTGFDLLLSGDDATAFLKLAVVTLHKMWNMSTFT